MSPICLEPGIEQSVIVMFKDGGTGGFKITSVEASGDSQGLYATLHLDNKGAKDSIQIFHSQGNLWIRASTPNPPNNLQEQPNR